MVRRISPDAVVDDWSKSTSYYLLDVALLGELRMANGEVAKIIPGMTATVDVLSGKRSVLEYFWQPIARIQELALRD